MLIPLRNQILKLVLLISCLGFLVLHLAVPINLAAVDIGRHIKNGELILSGHPQVLYENYYSFTYPHYPFINHHWFFGVLSYFLFRMSGFEGLTIFYILLLCFSFLIAFDCARRYSNFHLGLFAGVTALFLLISRPEIRPEGCSVFFVALDFWLLQRVLQGSISQRKVLFLIPFIQVFWVNTHIFFFLGPLLVVIFLWQAILDQELQGKRSFLIRLLFISIMVNLVNPSGLGGMLTPLNGFKRFGYELAENQTVLFMIHRFGDNLAYKYYFVTAVIMIVGMVLSLWRQGIKAFPMVFLASLVTVASFKAVRLIMPFGFLYIPLSAYFYAPWVKQRLVGIILSIGSILGILVCFLIVPANPHMGLLPNVNVSAEFFKQNGLKGPIFSNYDIGGYLIYHLQGQEKVFVDNRQEAFPVDFFQKTYIPMQEDPLVWKSKSEEYGFNIIYFYRHDLTPWGQGFMIDRISDPLWAPIFVDDYVIIFARRGSIDQRIIDRFELPKSMFKVTRS